MENMLECRSDKLDTSSWTMDLNHQSPALYCIRITELAIHAGDFHKLLDNAEVKRSQAYRNKKDSTRFVIARAALRIVLGKCLGSPPVKIEFELEPNMKPRLKHTDEWHFNVSHTDECALIAISRKPIGVDVEYNNKVLPYADVLDKVFSSGEQAYIRSDKQFPSAFYTLWTRKEALLKASGKGIDDDISLVPCLDGLHELPHTLHGLSGQWTLISFEPQADHIASVALAGNIAGKPALYMPDVAAWLGMT